jgi:putative methionine-R-sulfoxide reductase with GAF domain
VGIYEVDSERKIVSNLAWSGPGAPAYPAFPVTKGFTLRAIASKRTINVNNVANDRDYLTALRNTQSEIVVPVLDQEGQKVIGTIDVESYKKAAFTKETEQLLERCAETLRPLWNGD